MIKKRMLFKKRIYAYMTTAFLLFALPALGGCAGGEGAAGTDTENETVSYSDAERLMDGWERVEEESPEAVDIKLPEGDTGLSEEQSLETEEETEGETGLPEDSVRSLSIMGDSISTFDEWIPEGYYDFFPMSGEVTDVGQTWWKMVLEDTGMRLCVNASSSGSTCAGDSLGTGDPQHGCSDYRINGLADNGGSPDLIIVYMGTNDFIQNIPLGDNDGTRAVEEGNIENFSDAYTLILDKLHARYPNARIFCCNLLPVGGVGEDMTYTQFVNGQGLRSDDYSRQIEIIAASKGYPLIDIAGCGITVDNILQYVSDGTHPNPEGMKLLRDAVETAIAEQ